uniref:Uncharacterized protein n=1 Tax=Clytia hemisphaerica TaxID=252671 RepID=A0A7M5TTJ0_9CNID
MSLGNGTTTFFTPTTILSPMTTLNTITPNVVTETSNQRLLIGVVLAIIGNLLISVSMNVQKYSHTMLKESNKSYVKSPTWWCGIILMVIGEVGNFTAYAFAPASLVAPLGTTTVIANAVIAVVFLKETVRYQDFLGITLAIVGAFLLINFSKKNETILNAEEIMEYAKHLPFILYLVLEISVFILLVYFHHKFNAGRVVTVLLQVAILGSFTVISAKAVSSMLSSSFQGDNQFKYPIFYLMLLIMVVTALLFSRFLNQAMASHDTTVVVPTNFVFFTMSAILSGIVFYREFYGLEFLEIFMFLFGAVLSFIGVYFITGDREKDEEGPAPEERQELLNDSAGPSQRKPAIYTTLNDAKRVQPENTSDNNFRAEEKKE